MNHGPLITKLTGFKKEYFNEYLWGYLKYGIKSQMSVGVEHWNSNTYVGNILNFDGKYQDWCFDKLSPECEEAIKPIGRFFEAITPKDYKKEGKCLFGMGAIRDPFWEFPLIDELQNCSFDLAK